MRGARYRRDRGADGDRRFSRSPPRSRPRTGDRSGQRAGSGVKGRSEGGSKIASRSIVPAGVSPSPQRLRRRGKPDATGLAHVVDETALVFELYHTSRSVIQSLGSGVFRMDTAAVNARWFSRLASGPSAPLRSRPPTRLPLLLCLKIRRWRIVTKVLEIVFAGSFPAARASSRPTSEECRASACRRPRRSPKVEGGLRPRRRTGAGQNNYETTGGA